MAITVVKASGQGVALGSNTNLGQNVDGFTGMAWAKIALVDSAERFIFCTANNLNATNSRFHISSAANSGKFRCTARRTDAEGGNNLESAMTPSLNTLYHICFRAYYGGGVLDCFVNGVLDNSLSIGSWTGNSSNTVSLNSNIACRGTLGSQQGFFEGTIDDVRLYPWALDDGEILQIAKSGGRDRIIGSHRYMLNEKPPGSTLVTAVNKWNGLLPGSAVGSPPYSASLVSHRSRPDL